MTELLPLVPGSSWTLAVSDGSGKMQGECRLVLEATGDAGVYRLRGENAAGPSVFTARVHREEDQTLLGFRGLSIPVLKDPMPPEGRWTFTAESPLGAVIAGRVACDRLTAAEAGVSGVASETLLVSVLVELRSGSRKSYEGFTFAEGIGFVELAHSEDGRSWDRMKIITHTIPGRTLVEIER
jgi:hypothetical protein